MAVGLGARKSNQDTKYFVAANQAGPDNYVTGGVAAGPALVPFPGFGGNTANTYNFDTTSLLVWGITVGAILVVLGVHASFGGHKIF